MLSRKTIQERQERRQSEREANMAQLAKPVKTLHRGVYAPVDAVIPAPKPQIVRSEAYRRIVAAMPCCICGMEGYSQCAHGNLGKGMALKSDDRYSFALCGPRPGIAGCHAQFDQGALFTKDERRAFEKFAATFTQKLIASRGLWPANLPRMEDQPCA